MGDNIRELPIDTVPPTNDEKEMIHWMFRRKKNLNNKNLYYNNNNLLQQVAHT